jgi:Na+-transporting methylmalonyl-CoA/oxaloacetate decarboxylase gamma subunit
MVFLAITADTWLVTCLGFCIVLLLLFVFIYVMKALGWIMQPRKQSDVVRQNNDMPAVATTVGSAQQEDEKAAVAYALHLYYNSLHDMDSPRITVRNHTTAWHIIH